MCAEQDASAPSHAREALRAAEPASRRLVEGAESSARYQAWIREHDTLNDADRAAIRARIATRGAGR